VGNGGFSLRNVQSCLRVLEKRDSLLHWTDPLAIAAGFTKRVAASAKRGAGALFRGETASFWQRSRQAVEFAALDAPPQYRNEDLFWTRAPDLLPSFRIPVAEKAVAFAFETEPRFCYAHNEQQLPFGCHQWFAYDPDFWQPYLHIATGDPAC